MQNNDKNTIIIIILKKKIFISYDQLEEFQWIFQEKYGLWPY